MTKKNATDTDPEMGKPLTERAALALGVRDAAVLLSVSEDTIRRMIEDDELRVVRLRGRIVIPRSEIDALLQSDDD